MEEDHVYEHEHEHEHGNNNDSSIVNLYYRASSVHDTHVHPLSSSDEMSMLLHQILCHSSSSSPATVTATTSSSNTIHVVPQQLEINNAHLLSKSSGISPVDFVNTSVGGGGPLSSGNVLANGANVSSASVGHSENETTDEHDCQSEEGFQASIDEVTAKPARPRSSSKRSRAAEVHNLSEKRRRSRINEKMKALQNLIPNSHKTDKASMLDEAIEYLKHLQVQVQMLTMRNGIPLRSMCLPGVLPPNNLRQMKMGSDAEIGSLHTNTTGRLVSQETELQNMFNLPNQCDSSNQLQLPNMSNIINPGTVFTIDAPIQANLGTIQCGTASGETSREDSMPHQLNVSRSVKNPSGGFDKKDSSSLEACMIGRDRAEGCRQVELSLVMI